MASKVYSSEEVGAHHLEDDAWIVVNGVVWDVTGFAKKHPGGRDIIEAHWGKDGSEAYNEIHSPGLIAKHFGADRRLGVVQASAEQPATTTPQNALRPAPRRPNVSSFINLAQFEEVAARYVTSRTWGYVHGATEDGWTNAANAEWFRRILFRPRILRQVEQVDLSTTVLGRKYDLPIFCAPTSSVKLSHPDGEVAIAKASVAHGVATIVPSLSSYTIEEIMEAIPQGYPFFFQLYFRKDREGLERLLDVVCSFKPQAILVTVDLPVVSKREDKTSQAPSPNQSQENSEAMERTLAPPPASDTLDANLNWDDIPWLKKRTGVPIILKGIQSAADARRAYEYGCAGIYLSNHGGRALDTAPTSIHTLLEIHATCPEILDKIEVFVDGGVRRGSDVLKALCLGASAVFVGRPFLYALACGGEEGMTRAFESTFDITFLKIHCANHIYSTEGGTKAVYAIAWHYKPKSSSSRPREYCRY